MIKKIIIIMIKAPSQLRKLWLTELRELSISLRNGENMVFFLSVASAFHIMLLYNSVEYNTHILVLLSNNTAISLIGNTMSH